MQNYNYLQMSMERDFTLCGNNIYPSPTLHPDRIMAEHDILFIEEGIWSIAVENEVYPNLIAGDLIFLRGGIRHYGISNCSRNAKTKFIHFAPLPQDRFLPIKDTSALRGTENNNLAVFPTVVHCSDLMYIEDLFNQLSQAFWSRREDKKRKMNLLFNLLLNEINYCACQNMPEESDWCARMIRIFSENISKTYEVEELAAEFGMSPRTLSSHFSKLMGTSIRQYQINMKLELAYQALCGAGLSVKEVAARYGFCDAYYFSRIFKKKYGFSPNSIKNREPSENIYRIYK